MRTPKIKKAFPEWMQSMDFNISNVMDEIVVKRNNLDPEIPEQEDLKNSLELVLKDLDNAYYKLTTL